MEGKRGLSLRLLAVADMVSPGNRVCDVGCDHGYLPIYLIEQKISPKVLAMDVREGPLGHARAHVSEAGLTDYITLRLSDGLTGFGIGEAETLVCAGMGGRLMQRILERDPSKTGSFRELILQPQSEIAAFRRFLREQGYSIVWEDMVWEEEKFYPVIKAVPGEQISAMERKEQKAFPGLPEGICAGDSKELEDRFGPVLLERKHPVLLLFLERERESMSRLTASLKKAAGSQKAAGRLKELLKETDYIEEAMGIVKNDAERGIYGNGPNYN